MYRGGAGGFTFYVRGGEQVIRQRKNNSNYGDTASRTYAQMIRRIRWGNIVNIFKSIKSWQKKAYDSKLAGQTDYNWFMKLNVNKAIVGTSKEMNEAGCAIVEGYQVSVGSLPPINNSVAGSGTNYVTDIVLTNAITSSTTVGQLATDILNNNPQFEEGDNIAFVFFRNWLTSRTEWPYAASVYTEITLDKASTKLVSAIVNLGSRLSKSTGNFLQASYTTTGLYDVTHEVGFVAIHTRKTASMLAVSSQDIIISDNSLITQFSGADWDNQCIATYGLTEEVPLDPSFPEGSISGVTANGAAIQSGAVLQGSQIIRVSGSNLSSANCKFVFNGVEYTPLGTGDGYLEYILTDNGTARISLNGRPYMNFRVEGVVVPSDLGGGVFMAQTDQTASSAGSVVHRVDYDSPLCMQYPYKVDSFYVNYRMQYNVGGSFDIDDLAFVNCATNATPTIASGRVNINAAVTDASQVAYVTYQGFIIAVFNYQ